LVAIGIVFGSRIAEWHGERNGVKREHTADFLLYTISIGLASAVVLNMVFYEPHKIAAMFRGEFHYPGLSSYGGFIGGIGAAFWFRHKKRLAIFALGDIWCFAFPFAWLFGRTGCFVVHDHPGTVTDFPLAVANYNLEGQARHDLGLYEVIWSAVVIVLFLILGQKRRKRGFYMALLPILYAPLRFFLDFLREVPANGGDVRYAGLTPGQYASIAFTVIGVLVAMRVANRPEAPLYLDGEPAPEPSSKSEPPRASGRAPKSAKTAKARR
jgi:phosphatidylglycerol:prolipoprotein diacylglycerol transferase